VAHADLNHASIQELEDQPAVAAGTRDKMVGFGQHGFAGQEGGFDLRKLIERPAVPYLR
jgi:hypothetical protein